jgi:Tol biopolymer transport system component
MNRYRWCLFGVLLVVAVSLSACDFLFPDDGGPVALQLSPARGIVRSEVIVVGEGFGAVQGTGAVTFDDVPATVLSWSDTILTVEVPVIATPGGASVLVEVLVAAEGGTIGRGEFTVARGILFESERFGHRDIWVIDAEGGDPIQLTDDPATESWPCWSHDGTRILYNRGTEIRVMNADGSGNVKLEGNGFVAVFPAWSPDGGSIAYQRGEMSEIYVMDSDGSGQRNVTNALGIDAWPTWSADGSRIVFHADRNYIVGDSDSMTDDPDIYVVNADGTGETRLTDDPGRDFLPIWSPDGSRIVFISNREGPGEIFVMNADGSGQDNVTNDPGAADGWPSWSPDGTKIAFQSFRDGNGEIYVMNADGSGLSRLTANAVFDAGPSWSPDGTKIAFESERDGNLEIYVMNADGSDPRRLTDHTAFDGYPVWTESRWIPVRP